MKYKTNISDTASGHKFGRRIVTATFVSLVVVVAALSTFGIQTYIAERRRQAREYLALGREQLDKNPTGALAYAIASIETRDDMDTRRFAVDVLRSGLIGIALDGAAFPKAQDDSFTVGLICSFSPDGRWLAVSDRGSFIQVWSRDGGPPRVIRTPGSSYGCEFVTSDLLFVPQPAKKLWHFIKIPSGDIAHTLDMSAYGGGALLESHALLLKDRRGEGNRIRWTFEKYSYTDSLKVSWAFPLSRCPPLFLIRHRPEDSCYARSTSRHRY